MKEVRGLVKVGVAAHRLGLSIPHTYRLAKAGELPCVRIGVKAVRFEEEAIERYISQHRRKAG